MYVCLCLGVTDHQIRETVAAGAASADEVMYCTGAGTSCGTCRASVTEIAEEALAGCEAAAPSSSHRTLRVLRRSSAA